MFPKRKQAAKKIEVDRHQVVLRKLAAQGGCCERPIMIKCEDLTPDAPVVHDKGKNCALMATQLPKH